MNAISNELNKFEMTVAIQVVGNYYSLYWFWVWTYFLCK